ncbi:DUF2515 family protein [Halobacillus rhizosphaerae]|uniref:DUF2515 family protein n=1 Tax=Halobacillus rhizosphaerae TaxID=3064889 RepID=UPI00398AE397
MTSIKQDLLIKLKKEPLKKPEVPNAEEEEILQSIRSDTVKFNINNVTRTQAYYDFYYLHPEIKWSLLAHMVSRNGGWNMTDLKGEFLSKLLSEGEQKAFFAFLERGNWLIFQDAFPQLLLYKKSVEMNRSLFYLLPHLNVSSFMEVIWKHFWENGHRDLLAFAQIINEQMYIEERVIHHQSYQNSVLKTINFKLQDVLNLNHLLFPYSLKEQSEPEIIGETLHHFASIEERIEFGKRLYALLFFDYTRLQHIITWVNDHPHTGSRKDYMPHLFNDVKETLPGQLYFPRTKNCILRKNAPRLYSPALLSAWKTSHQKIAEKGDWFKNISVMNYFKDPSQQDKGKITVDYCESIEKMELALFTSKLLFHRKE